MKKEYYIDTVEKFNKLISKAKKQKVIAIDTEFLWRKTYYPILGLVQVAFSKEECYLIDTIALKNIAYGAISNTSRLHDALWAETCAEASAFPPLRDKVVLNIVDGIKGCFNGGPGAKPEFITEFNSVLLGTDPVAVDRIGYDIILKKRIEEGIQDEDSPTGKLFLEMASKLKLGESDINKIELKKIDVG